MKGSEFSKEEKAHIQKSLSTRLGPEWLSYRAAAGGRKVAYLEGFVGVSVPA
jgi:recombination DNA repair RAD52 pathway protein